MKRRGVWTLTPKPLSISVTSEAVTLGLSLLHVVLVLQLVLLISHHHEPYSCPYLQVPHLFRQF